MNEVDQKLAELMRKTVDRYFDDLIQLEENVEPDCMSSRGRHTDMASDFLLVMSEAKQIIEEHR